MVRAYILIETAAGHARALVDFLRGQESVRDVVRVTGQYDVIAVLEAGDVDEISNTVTDVIHPREGVARTITCVSIG